MKRSQFSQLTGLTNRRIRYLTDNHLIPFTRTEAGQIEYDEDSIHSAKLFYKQTNQMFYISTLSPKIFINSINLIAGLGLKPSSSTKFINSCCNYLIANNAHTLTVNTTFHHRGAYIASELSAFCLTNCITFIGGRNV